MARQKTEKKKVIKVEEKPEMPTELKESTLHGKQDKQKRSLVGEKCSYVSSHMNNIDDLTEGCFVER